MLNQSDASLVHAGIKILRHELLQNEINHGFNQDEDQTYYIVNELGIHEKVDLSQLFAARRIALIHSEVSEALEGIRKPHPDFHCEEFTNEEIELADAIIRILTTATQRQLRIEEAILAKMEYNESRPFKHGKAF